MRSLSSRVNCGWILTVLAGCVSEQVPKEVPAAYQSSAVRQGQPSILRGANTSTGPKALGAGWQDGPLAIEDSLYDPMLDAQPLEFEVNHELPPVANRPYERFEWNLIRNPDGTFTKLYFFRVSKAKSYLGMMRRMLPKFAALEDGRDYRLLEKYVTDPRRGNQDLWHKGGDFGLPFGDGEVADLLIVTAREETLREIDHFLERVLGDAPQVEIEVTIVEIALSDELQIGTKWDLTRSQPDNPENNLIDTVVTDLAHDLVSGTFGSFSAVHDDTVVNGLLELLQTVTYSNVLSSPKLAVLNGHRAIIDTGAETPVFTPTFNNSGVTQITTSFKPTGIKVIVVPFLLSPDLVQLEISVEVSSVTGFVTAGIGEDSEVENPLIARRNAHTIVHVPSGRTVLIGGLVSNDEVTTIDKIPLLGDIPWLGKLFQRSTDSVQQAQVLFLVRPKILTDRFRAGHIYDPAEDFATEPGARE